MWCICAVLEEGIQKIIMNLEKTSYLLFLYTDFMSKSNKL